jgi:nucleoside 2-deoxyribosyltransferase
VITAAVKQVPAGLNVTTWEENDIAGRPLIDPILEQIDSSDALLCDVTRLNFNVTFEIGFAIARNKRLIITRNSSFARDERIDLVGIFDTLGYNEYENSKDLLRLIADISSKESLLTNYPLNIRLMNASGR